MPDTLEIIFEDLESKAQKEVLKFYGYENPEDGNLDVVPSFILEKQQQDGKDR